MKLAGCKQKAGSDIGPTLPVGKADLVALRSKEETKFG